VSLVGCVAGGEIFGDERVDFVRAKGVLGVNQLTSFGRSASSTGSP
jgi:hypothetical protein